jgi:hypothetical protein
MAFAPMATKGGRNALFGEQAIAQTSKTVNTIANKGGQALSGAKTWFGVGSEPQLQPAFAGVPNGSTFSPAPRTAQTQTSVMKMEGIATEAPRTATIRPSSASRSSSSVAEPHPVVPTPAEELIGRYPKAQAKLLREKPEVQEQLKNMQPDELETALADPKILKGTIAKAKVASRVEGKKLDELSPAQQKSFDEH